MTAKEKANQLVNRFMPFVEAYSSEGQIANAIECALMVVDEMKSVLPFTDIGKSLGRYCESERNFLDEVISEINNFKSE